MSANFQATAGELALVSRILAQGDPKRTGQLAGDVAVRIFGGANLPPTVLGEIWAMADEDNQGHLTSKGIALAVRLMGHAQKGERVTPALLSKPGPLPTIDGVTDIAPQGTGMSFGTASPNPAALPPLTPQDKAKFLNMFNRHGPVGGLLNGEKARDIFVKSKLPHDILGQIWTLADTQERGSLDSADFAVAMFFIQGVMSGQISTLPQTLPPSLYQQASGIATHATGNSGTYSPVGSAFGRVQPQYTGQSPAIQPNLTGNVTGRRTASGPSPQLPARPYASQIGSSVFGTARQPPPVPWDVTVAEKTESDGFFDTLDTERRGFIEGDVAVPFMLESQLPGEDLALVWDLADLENNGRLTKNGFAIAMHLIKKKLAGNPLPDVLPESLIPPAMRAGAAAASPFAPAAPVQPQQTAQESLADLIWDDPPPAAPPIQAQSTGMSIPLQPQMTGARAMSPALKPQTTGTLQAQTTGNLSRIASPPPPMPPRSFGSPAPAPPIPSRDPFGGAAADLMGDDEDVVPNTPDRSAEIANVQNQVNQANQGLKTAREQREAAEATAAAQASQLASLETQLSSAKAAFETESKMLATLKERLGVQTADINKAREAIITAESDLSAVRVEKSEVEQSLLRDKEEVRDLQRKMMEYSQQTESLKAETEKLKKEAKQQRGLLAIARKQLHSKEVERSKAASAKEEASDDHAAALREKAEIEAEIAKPPIGFATPDRVVSPGRERSFSEDSLSFAAAQPLPGSSAVSPSVKSANSNNPFHLVMSSGTSTPTRTGSPFGVPPVHTASPPAPDPFGFDKAFEDEADKSAKPADEPAAPKELFAEAAPASADPISPASEEFKTPESQSGELPWTARDSIEATIASKAPETADKLPDVAADKFPDLNAEPDIVSSQQTEDTHHVPGHFPEGSTDLTHQLKELEVDDSDSSDDEEDNKPLSQVAAEAKSNGNGHSQSQSGDAGGKSFDDIFGAPEGKGKEPEQAPSTNAFGSSPFGTATSSPFAASPAPDTASTPVAGVNAFDEAMGMIPAQSTGAPAATAPTFSFDDAFDDNFDFGSAPAPAAAPATNGDTSKSNDGFDSLFTSPAPKTNGGSVSPAASPASAIAPASSAPGPSFDDVFSGFDTPPHSQVHGLGSTLNSEPAPPSQPSTMSHGTTQSQSSTFSQAQLSQQSSPPAQAFPAVSPPRSTTASPPPRVSSPTPPARPRPSTGSSDKLAPQQRHSKLSFQIRLPFGKKKKQQEAAAASSQFLTPPSEEPRSATPASDDDVEAVKQITAMGFSRTQAVEALEKYGYDVNRALNSLLGMT
ncbi:hypothetical protein CYLTODRAFT_380256 [Cylindrobasidium torrendii FP15055 ss-10]|uniref:UBA domain-containing protein n=1 Tax=Cylindrobasidium torrendii FP15055 ss-10 TaxID=1314674 RepID=A0A0D7B352_9AGAR|nr:hypothetical protein CYLTODRAFT_380256 [Cylindrobasidium torrendii FP15055 ss-10]